MGVNNKTYFYRYTVRGNGYKEFNYGTLTVKNEDAFDPVQYLKDTALRKYPNHHTLDITALNPL